MCFYKVVRPLIFSMDAEKAHGMAITALKLGLVPSAPKRAYSRLKQNVWGMEFPTPVGLAPGFDKNAEVWHRTQKQGFGFVEVGTVTPRPQVGNDKPRLFRLTEDEAVINRFGFNNVGVDAFVDNMQKHSAARARGIVGVNIGKNKDAEDAVSDYLYGLTSLYAFADYITVNISSPNTAGLRDLQEKEALLALVKALVARRTALAGQTGKKVPLLVKIAPDISDSDKSDIVDVAMTHGIDGLIVSNTTIGRPESLKSIHKDEKGGLSGKPLLTLSTQVLRDIYKVCGGKLPLIGVGGIASADDAYAKIKAGASLVQVYSALVYQGFGLVTQINDGLEAMLARDGFATVAEAVGKG